MILHSMAGLVQGASRLHYTPNDMKELIDVFRMTELPEETRAKVVPVVSAGSVTRFINETVTDGSTLYTDGSVRYPNFPYKRETVNHGKGEYVRGDVHVNSVESFHGHVKRSIRGVYKSVSKKHYQSYLDAYVWHRNNRRNDRLRFGALLACIVRPVAKAA